MQEITSLQNSIIKTVAGLHLKKHRQELELFIIEGYKGVDEALNSGLEVEYIFLNKTASYDSSNYPQDKLYLADDKIMKKISTTETPCEVLCVAKYFKYSLKDLFKIENPIIIVLEDIKDPGNLGTIIRTSKAAGVSGIILTGDVADIFNPKTVRSSAANLWKIPIISMKNKQEIKQTLIQYKEFQFIATSGSLPESENYFNINYKPPSVLMFGSEANGISKELIKISDIIIKIPMDKEVESLNISVSHAVIAYEVLRQRKE